MSGRVFMQHRGVQLASLATGGLLKSGSVVITDRNGRAKLVRGDQTMIVSPNSMVTLPGSKGGSTKIIEGVGLVEYDIDHRKVQHFSVETPFLAAVVKGTRFKVKVSKSGASVGVLRGMVEVTNLRSGEHANILAGQIAFVNSSKGITIRGKGAIQKIIPGPVREALVAPPNGSGIDTVLGGVSAIATAGASANVGGVSASVGVGGVSASVGSGTSAGVGRGGVSVGVGGVSAGVGSGGVSVGGLAGRR
ncbi:FecR domain-containing protein [Mesorhizobium sp. 10J20-29]